MKQYPKTSKWGMAVCCVTALKPARNQSFYGAQFDFSLPRLLHRIKSLIIVLIFNHLFRKKIILKLPLSRKVLRTRNIQKTLTG